MALEVRVAEAEGVEVRGPDRVGVALGLLEGVELRSAEAEGEAEAEVADSEAERVRVAEHVEDRRPLRVAEGVCVRVRGVAVGEYSGDDDTVGVAVPV